MVIAVSQSSTFAYACNYEPILPEKRHPRVFPNVQTAWAGRECNATQRLITPHIRRADDPNPPLLNVTQFFICCQQIVCRPKFEIEGWGFRSFGSWEYLWRKSRIAALHPSRTQQLHGEQSSTRQYWWIKGECIQHPTRGVGNKRREDSPKTTAVRNKDHLKTAPSLMTASRPMLPMRGRTDLCPCGSCGESTSSRTRLCPTCDTRRSTLAGKCLRDISFLKTGATHRSSGPVAESRGLLARLENTRRVLVYLPGYRGTRFTR